MVECEFCDEEFEDKVDLHAHWMEEHEEELNSHQKDQAKKSKREKDEMKKKERERKKNLAFKAIVSGLVLVLAAVMIPQLLNSAPENGGDDTSGVSAVNFTLEEEPMMGDESAEVTIVEFGDFYCPACQSFTANVKPRIEADYVETGKAKFYYMDFPLSIHEPQASASAEAAECVYRQNESAYWDYHDALYENQKNFEYSTSGLVELARTSTSGINYEEMQSCIESGEASSEVNGDFNTGVDAGVGGTPTIYVNGKQAPDFGYETISSMIERELPN